MSSHVALSQVMSTIDHEYQSLKEKRTAKYLHAHLGRWKRQDQEQWGITRGVVFKRANGLCQSPITAAPKQHGICEEVLSLNSCHIDHIRALTHGGSNHVFNLRVLCPTCHALREDAAHEGMRRGLVNKRELPKNWRELTWAD